MKLASKRSDRLSRSSTPLRIAIAIALTTTAFGAEAAGLGRLNVLSALGQPLRAEIELNSVQRDEEASLTARLASPDAFSQANIEYGSVLSGLRLSVQRRASGKPYVLVTSSQLLNEPFLDLLVELNWGSGRLVRAYTVLIDPPGSRGLPAVEPGATVAQAQSPPVVARPPRPRPAPRPPPPMSSEQPQLAASSPAAAPARTRPAPPPPVAGGAGGDYLVRPGDTALSIARNNKPDGVSLEQMLAAMYRDNPAAFSGNINVLLAGATLKFPDAATAQALDATEARRVIASSVNFGAYRERIARSAADAPTAKAAGQQASGKLSTQVVDGSVPAAEAADRLQLSQPDAARAASAPAAARTGAVATPGDDLAAKDRELQETRARLALLEKSVADLQQLLLLKNQSLTDLQKGAAPKAADSVVAPVPAATAPAASAPPPVAAPSTAPPPAPVAAAPVRPAATPKAAPLPVAEESWFDSLKDNTLLLVGLLAIVLLLIGYAIFTIRRRRTLASFEDSIFVDNSVLHANSVFGTTGGQSVDTANSGFNSNFVPVAGQLPEQSEVDPVAEADVYIAYGRDAQAEEILKEALRENPGRHAVSLKLLEIYAKRGDAKTFETTASELYAATDGQGEDWKQAAALGAGVDPHNPLYTEAPDPAPLAAPEPAARPPSTPRPAIGAAVGATAGAAVGAAAAAYGASTMNMGDSPSAGQRVGARPDIAYLKTEVLEPEPMPADAPSMDLDFDLGFANDDKTSFPTVGTTGSVPSAPARAPVPSVTETPPESFTASTFIVDDSLERTAVEPAFRARPPEPIQPQESDGFSASDIFGSSIVGDEPAFSETPRDTTPIHARTQDFRHVVDSHDFDRTEPIDAFSNINLDLDNSSFEPSDLKSDYGVKTDIWQAMATKLDLALAYSDIGDKDGARELLEEVVRSGDPAQADRARRLIGELG